MSYTAHKETDEETGVTLTIIADEDARDLDPAMNDDAIIMAALHQHYANPARHHKKAFPRDDFDSQEGLECFECDHVDEWEAFPLFMYDHSGTAYSIRPFACPWDSGRVGTLFVKRANVTPAGADPKEACRKAAEGFCTTYTAWANGNVWGYVVEDAEGEHLDSCWGFIGDSDDDYLMSCAREAFETGKAQAQEAQARIARHTMG